MFVEVAGPLFKNIMSKRILLDPSLTHYLVIVLSVHVYF